MMNGLDFRKDSPERWDGRTRNFTRESVHVMCGLRL